MHDIIGKAWDKEEIPTEWKEGYLVKLPKKGDLQQCKNYRGIISRVILDRLKTESETTRQASIKTDHAPTK